MEETRMKLKIAAAAMLSAMVAGVCAPAAAQEVTLKIHHFLPPPSPAHARLITPWCEKIGKESGGKLKCQIFPSMSMGGTPPQLYDQAKDGVADIVWTLPGYTANRFPTVEAFELPFMMTNPEATSRALWEYTQLHSKAEFKDVHPILFHVHGPGVFHMREKQIKTLADFKGLKVRAPHAHDQQDDRRARRDPGGHARAAGARGAEQGRDRRHRDSLGSGAGHQGS
jgi:TRAP-type C4-dicarboxylate transport system substrate-binding protein